jgi:hypothetical protein
MKRVVSGKMVIVMLLVAVAPAFNRDNRHHVNDGGRGTILSAKRMPFSLQSCLVDDP